MLTSEFPAADTTRHNHKYLLMICLCYVDKGSYFNDYISSLGGLFHFFHET